MICNLCGQPYYELNNSISLKNRQTKKVIEINHIEMYGKKMQLCPHCFAMMVFVKLIDTKEYDLVIKE